MYIFERLVYQPNISLSPRLVNWVYDAMHCIDMWLKDKQSILRIYANSEEEAITLFTICLTVFSKDWLKCVLVIDSFEGASIAVSPIYDVKYTNQPYIFVFKTTDGFVGRVSLTGNYAFIPLSKKCRYPRGCKKVGFSGKTYEIELPNCLDTELKEIGLQINRFRFPTE